MADDGINVMQAQLGLAGAGGASFGIPTPMPRVRHPGEVSQESVQQTQTASFQTMQSAMMTRPGGGGMYGTPVGPFGAPVGDVGAYARMFQQNMSSMNAQMFNPYVAQTMAGMGGFGGNAGFTPGMLPSPIHMTSPHMGIFRPFPQGPAPSIPPTPQMPLVPMPWTPRPVAPHFSTPFDYNWQIGQQRSMQHEAAFMAAPGAVARGGIDVGFAMGGAGLGANLGARFAGVGGAKFGGLLGAAGGLALAELGGFGQAGQHIIDSLNPYRTMGLRTAQMRGITPEFVVGGAELSPDGRGLSSGGARHLARRIEDIGWDSKFRKQTGNMFNVQDLTRMTQMAGEQGMLDMHQGSDQIAGQVKNIAKTVRTLMRVMGEPDVKEAIKQLGQMNQMGLSLPEMERTLQNAKTYARMAGTSVRGIMEAGLAGAATFQSQGLTAGLGLQVGMGAMGMARQAVAGGAYTPQQLAMLGGVSGIAQRDMMTQAATLKLPMMAASMATLGPGGTFGLDPRAVQGLQGGKFDIHQLTTMGANNLLDAVNKGGVGALGLFQVQQRELQDQLGRTMGPVGMKVMNLNQVMNTRKLLGLGRDAGGLATAGLAMGMDEDQVRQMLGEANSPEYFRNMQRQLEVQRNEIRVRERERRKEETPGAVERWTRGGGWGGGAIYGARSFGQGFRNFLERTGNFFNDGAEDEAAWKNGQVVVRTDRSLLASSSQQARRIRSVDQKALDDVLRNVNGDDGERGFILGGKEFGRTKAMGDVLGAIGGDGTNLAQYREGQGGIESIIGGGTLERGARVANLIGRAFGGADYDDPEKIRRSLNARADSASTLKEGLSLSDTERAGLQKRLTAAFGGDRAKASQFRAEYEKRLAASVKGKSHLLGSTSAMEGEEKAIAESLAKEQGLDLSKFSTKDIAQLGAQGANLQSVMSGGEEMRLQDAVDMRGEQNIRNNLSNTQGEISKELFGEDGSWTQSSRRERVMEDLANASSSNVGTMAALIASGKTGEAAKIKDLIKDESEAEAAWMEAQRLAKDIVDRGDKDILEQMSSRLNTMQNPRAQNMWVEERRNKYLASKGAVQYVDGLKKMVKDSSLLEGNLDAHSVMQRLSKNRGALKGKAKDLADRYAKATSAKERQGIERELQQTGMDMGTVGTTDVRGGDASAAEAGVDAQQEGLAGAQGELAKYFPQSVKTFEESSKRMLEAATMLKQLSPDTALPVGVAPRR